MTSLGLQWWEREQINTKKANLRLALWYEAKPPMQWQHPTWALVHVPATPLPNQFTNYGLGKQYRMV